MDVRYRPVQPKDAHKCVEHLAKHPILGPRYGNLIEALPSAMTRALRDDYVTINVFEELQGSTTRFLGAGMAVFVSDDFLRAAKSVPASWIGPELVKRITVGKSPLLSEAEVRDANSTTGLNLMVWHNSCHPQDLIRIEIGVAIMTAFEETFRGFRLKEVFAQADSLEQFGGARDAGGFYFDPAKGCYGSWPEVGVGDFSDEPRNFGITQEPTLAHGGSWVGSLFAYGPPQIGFSGGEQRLLLSAIGTNGTDEELSENLGISLFAVKKSWRSIYNQVAAIMPELVPSSPLSDAQIQGRGKQKKQRLLAYLREHPEELCPFARKLLQCGATANPRA
jgi:hypothetical protein